MISTIATIVKLCRLLSNDFGYLYLCVPDLFGKESHGNVQVHALSCCPRQDILIDRLLQGQEAAVGIPEHVI